MPTYTIRIPDGRTVTIRAAAPEVAIADAEAWGASNPKHGSAADGYAQGQRQGVGSGLVDTLNRAIPGMSELGAAVETGGRAIDQLTRGQPVDLGADWAASRARQQGSVDALRAAHPVVSNLTTGTGFALPLAATLATGGAAAPAMATRVAATAARPTLARTAGTIAGRVGRNAITGAVVGAGYGAAQPGTVSERVANATAAMAPGAVLGAVAPEASTLVAKGANAAIGAGRKVINAFTGADAAPAAAAAPTGTATPPPAAEPAVPTSITQAASPTTAPPPAQGAPAAPPPGAPPPVAPPPAPPTAPPAGAGSSLSATERSALGKFVRVARPDVNAMTSRTAAYADAGIQPTLVDSAARSGQSVVRALASRPGETMNVVEDFANARRYGLANRISNQARDIVSSDPRSPPEIADQVKAARTEQANRQFDAVREHPLQISSTMANALESHYGQAAISEAAKRQLDPEAAKALDALAEHIRETKTSAGAPLTVGQAQAISRVLFDQANAAADEGKRTTLSAFGSMIREGAKMQNPGYEKALSDFADASALADAPAVGAKGLSTATDIWKPQIEAVRAIPGTVDDNGAVGAPQGINLARAGYRRAIETATGEGRPGSVMTAAENIAYAPERRERAEILLGTNDADRLANAFRLETAAVRNAAHASPGAGSNTFLNQVAGGMTSGEIAGHAAETMGSIAGAAHGNIAPAALQGLKAVLSGQAFSDEEADALARLAIDPTRHQDVLDYITAKAGPGAQQQFSQAFQQAISGGAAPAAATGQGNTNAFGAAPPPPP